MNQELHVTLHGEDKRLFMSFGMLNQLARLVGDFDNLPQLAINPDLQSLVMQVVMTPRDERGKATGEVILDELDLSFEDVDSIFAWVQENLFDFFLKGLEKTNELAQTNKDRILGVKNSMRSLAGSEPSAS